MPSYQLLQGRDKAATGPRAEGDRFIPRRVVSSVSDFDLHKLDLTAEDLASLDTTLGSLRTPGLSEAEKPLKNKQFFKYRTPKGQKSVLDALSEGSGVKLASDSRKKFELPKKPFKVLEAPSISDDFYHNIFDWSASNLLGVNLDNNIYVLHAETGAVTKLYEAYDCEAVTSLQWNEKGDQMAMGNILGQVSIWDVETQKELVNFDSHKGRVCALDWRSTLISGSKDGNIVQHDLRARVPQIKTFLGHTQEVCKLKWSPDEQLFCSGGNDNKVFVWSPQSSVPLMKESHQACVKAMAWSEKQYGVLATGGGSADRMIKTWNVRTKELIHERLTDSQVCSMVFSKHTNDLITAHGHPYNEINIWRANGLKKVGSLRGHNERVLYLNLSPCATTLVSCSGDETLRFWKLYEGYESEGVRHGDRLAEASKLR